MLDSIRSILKQLDEGSYVYQQTKMLEEQTIKKEVPLEESWEQYACKLQKYFRTHNDFFVSFKELFNILSRQSPEVIEKYLQKCIVEVEQIQHEERIQIQGKKRVGNSLGIMVGIITVLLLI